MIQWFLALISSHPEVQARAHAELDKVIGRDYWPSVEDEQRLPYVRAIIKEVRRQSTTDPSPSPSPSSNLGDFASRFSRSSISHYNRSNERTRPSGSRRRTSRPRTLCTMGCTYRRTRHSFSTATRSITTKRNIQTRKLPLLTFTPSFRWLIRTNRYFSFHKPPCEQIHFQP